MKLPIDYKHSTIVDVRTSEEFNEGAIAESINIPLHEIITKVDEIKNMEPPVILCCRSGQRSQQALDFLKNQGIENIYNGGGWKEVSEHLT